MISKTILKCLTRTLVVIALVAGSKAFAQEIDFNYAELRYLDSELGGVSGDGIELGGSYRINQDWLVYGSYSDQDFNSFVELETFEFGAGLILQGYLDFDLIARAALINQEIANDDENGVLLSIGVREYIIENLEGRGSLNYVNVDASDIFLELGLDYHFHEQFSAGAQVDLGSDDDTFSIGVRWFY